jgi:hypothetical protein
MAPTIEITVASSQQTKEAEMGIETRLPTKVKPLPEKLNR